MCVCVCVCLLGAELSLQPDPLLLHLPVGVSAEPPGLTVHSQSDSRTECVCVHVCVYVYVSVWKTDNVNLWLAAFFYFLKCFFFCTIWNCFLFFNFLCVNSSLRKLRNSGRVGARCFPPAVLSGSVYIGTKTYSPFLFLPCCTNRMKSDQPPVGVLKLKYLSPRKPGF